MGSAAVFAERRPAALLQLCAWPVLLAGPALALSAVLPLGQQYVCALFAIIILGVPHGALDGEIARSMLRPRLGWAWFPVFSLSYLSLFALVLLAWHVAPVSTLAAFLAASVWHFGTEDAKPGAHLEALVRGGLPIAVPMLVHPAATTAVFAAAAGIPLPQPPDWLWTASLAWLALAVVWTGCTALRGHGRALIAPCLLTGIFVALPPLTAFAIYFVGVHAPAHTAALIRNTVRAPRVRDGRSAMLLALPVTALTLLIGAGLWPFYSGAIPERLLSLTIQGLAALTLPHMLLDIWMTRRERQLAGSPLLSKFAQPGLAGLHPCPRPRNPA